MTGAIFQYHIMWNFYNFVYGYNIHVIKIIINACFKEAVTGSEYVIFMIICMY